MSQIVHIHICLKICVYIYIRLYPLLHSKKIRKTAFVNKKMLLIYETHADTPVRTCHFLQVQRNRKSAFNFYHKHFNLISIDLKMRSVNGRQCERAIFLWQRAAGYLLWRRSALSIDQRSAIAGDQIDTLFAIQLVFFQIFFFIFILFLLLLFMWLCAELPHSRD